MMNVNEIREDIERVVGCQDNQSLIFVNNYDWYRNMNILSFLRDVGK